MSNILDLGRGADIFAAIARGDSSELRRFVAHPRLLDERRAGMTALMYAAFLGSVEAVELLLQNGADPNEVYSRDTNPAARGTFEGAGRHDRFTALHFSVFYTGHPGVVEALLRAGARTDLVSATGWVPRALAERLHRREAAEVLRRYGAPQEPPNPPLQPTGSAGG
jgi:ankyrin repeat protein